MSRKKRNPSLVAASGGEENYKFQQPEDATDASPVQPFVDRHGHHHSLAVLRHWSPAVIRALRIRRAKPGSPEGGVV